MMNRAAPYLDPKRVMDEMLRVDHAGEYGAQRIYAGQLAVLGKDSSAPVIRDMMAQEEVHLATLNKLLPERRVRPSALMPLWHVGGWALGAASALLGPKAAMACTVAVESVIAEHYQSQIDTLRAQNTEPELRATLEQFQQDEVHHHDTALEHDAAAAPQYETLTSVIRAITRLAVTAAKKV